jgi:hypothetical protein
MSEQENKSAPSRDLIFWGVVFGCLLGVFALIAIPNFVNEPNTSPANACINNMRRIDAAKIEWASKHNAKTNDGVTASDIKPYLEYYLDPHGKPYVKLDAKGNLQKCPSGGFYTIGKIGEPVTCSLSNTVVPAHALP